MQDSNPYAPPSAPVRDMPPVDTAVELAGRGARLGAYLLDSLIWGILCFAPVAFLVGAGGLIGPNATPNYAAFLGTAGLAALPGFVILTVITVWLVVRNGQTIGKKIVGIKVVRSNGDKAGLGRIFWLRNVVVILLSLIPIAGGVISLVDALLIFRQSRQCLHDQIADTIVIQA